MTRHPDLSPHLTALRWFVFASSLPDQPLGEAANDNERPASVPDINPTLPKAEQLVADYEAGAVRFATARTWRMQFVRSADGILEPNYYPVRTGAITHIWGRAVTQDKGRRRPSEASEAVMRRREQLEWFCRTLRAVPAGSPQKRFKKIKQADPIDWTKFAHVRGDVPLEEAREAAGLPPADYCSLPGLPYGDPALAFNGLVAGKGARNRDFGGGSLRVKRPPVDHADNDIVDRITLHAFRQLDRGSYSTLETMLRVGSMANLVASNDSATGKRALVRAASSLAKFLAA